VVMNPALNRERVRVRVDDEPLWRLDEAERSRRAAQVRLVATDCDGVLTDGGVYVSEKGEALKRFSLRDGMGVERLRRAGIPTVIVTRESSPIVERRAEKLNIKLFGGVRDKAELLPALLKTFDVKPHNVAYIGDDVNDLGIMRALEPHGLTAAPADAEPVVAERVHVHLGRRGGHGAFRSYAELILALRDNPTRDLDQQGLPPPNGGVRD